MFTVRIMTEWALQDQGTGGVILCVCMYVCVGARTCVHVCSSVVCVVCVCVCVYVHVCICTSMSRCVHV